MVGQMASSISYVLSEYGIAGAAEGTAAAGVQEMWGGMTVETSIIAGDLPGWCLGGMACSAVALSAAAAVHLGMLRWRRRGVAKAGALGQPFLTPETKTDPERRPEKRDEEEAFVAPLALVHVVEQSKLNPAQRSAETKYNPA